MRFRIGGLAGVGAFALVALLPAPASRPLELRGPSPNARVGLVAGPLGTFLVRLDPRTLRRSHGALRLNGLAGAWAFAPDGRSVAIAVRPGPQTYRDALRVFRVAGPAVTKLRIPLGGPAVTVAWVRPDRILAYINADGSGSVVAVDPGARRIVSRTSLPGNVLHLARSGDSLVLLVADSNRIGRARLVLVDADGATHAVALDGIVAGMSWPQDPGSDPIGARQVPALAVDAEAGHAFVIAPDGTVADVELRSLAVAYHRMSEPQAWLDRVAAWLTPAAGAKGMSGPALSARWLGNGLLGLTGSEETATVTGGQPSFSGRPLGLRIVDTRDWSARMLDPGADAFTVADGLLLVTGSSWGSDSQVPSGMGLAVYGPGRDRRLQVLPGRPAWLGFVYRGRAYITLGGESRLTIVDLDSGQIIGTRGAQAPWPLLGDASSF